jgi:hypothetical protein
VQTIQTPTGIADTGLPADYSSWTLASGRASVVESQMAGESALGRILQANGESEILSQAGDTLLGETLDREQDLRESEQDIAECYRSLMKELREISPDPGVADLVLVQRELRSLKNHVKREHMDLPVSSPPSIYESESWERLWQELATDLPAIFEKVMERTRDVPGFDPRDPVMFDSSFDGATLLALCEAAEGTDSEMAGEYFRRYDTTKGVEFIMRARTLGLGDEMTHLLLRDRHREELFTELQQYAPDAWPDILSSLLDGIRLEGMEEAEGIERTRAFVRAADRWLMELVRPAPLTAFGPDRVFGCVVGLEAESYNMRIAVVGRANDMNADELRDHLRVPYV